MKKTVYRICSILAFLAFLCACEKEQDEQTLVFHESSSPKALLSAIEQIHLIPLQTQDAPLLGSQTELFLLNDSYLVSDAENAQLLRYDLTGRFLNAVGTQGNGPGEYIDIRNVQIVNEEIVVFSTPDKVLHYRPTGEFLSETHTESLGTQSWIVPEGVFSYYSFGSGKGHRAGLWEQDTETPFLKDDAKIIHFSAGSPVFWSWNGQSFLTDAYTPAVLSYSNKEVHPLFKVDFGKAAIPDDFYSFEDAFAAMEFLLSRKFALIQRYLTNDQYQFLEVFIQDKDKLEAQYGIAKDGIWEWFSVGKIGKDPLAGAFKTMDNHALYCLVDPPLLEKADKSLNALMSNPEATAFLSLDDNPVIVILTLK